jgi:hypothetical protein
VKISLSKRCSAEIDGRSAEIDRDELDTALHQVLVLKRAGGGTGARRTRPTISESLARKDAPGR